MYGAFADLRGDFTMDNELSIAIDEIESYHGVKLTELLMRLAKNPIVRHFKGNVYRVIGVGRDCVTDVPQVLYSPLDGRSILDQRVGQLSISYRP